MRARRLARLLGCTFLAACAACDNAGGNPFGGMGPGSDGGGLAAHSITDANGFERPMEAVRIMVPRGWRVGSSVKWDGNGQCSLDIASPMARLTSPDGLQVIDLLPGFLVSTWADPILNRGIQPADYCVVAKAESGEALLREVDVDMHGVVAGDENEMVARAREALLRAGQSSQEGGAR